MVKSLKIVAWNANGLLKHQSELQALLNIEKIDVCLISETHFTKQCFANFQNYETYCTNHPNNTARGGSAIIVKKSIEHVEEDKYCTPEFQATTISIKANSQLLSITAVYSPLRHAITSDQYKHLIRKHNNKFIMGGL